MIEKLLQRFLALQARERLLVSAAATILILALFFLLIWEPLHEGVKRSRADLASMQSLVAELSQARSMVLSGRSGIGVIQGQERSLLSIVDQTGKESGLGDAITRMQPEGESTVRIWLEKADFAAMIRWVNALESTYGIAVVEAAIDRDTQPGLVRARFGLVRGTP